MSTSLALRVPRLEWAHQAAAGDLTGVRWVDVRMDPQLAEVRQVQGPSGELRFRRQSYLRYVPGVVAESALQAQGKGRATAWEAQQLLFARAEWLVAVREYLWAPQSPVPQLLATLVETFGVEPAIHGHDPERLARLAALLPVWHPHRGSVSRAREVLEMCDRAADVAAMVDASGLGSPDAARLEDEVLMVHDLSWWRLRAERGAVPLHRISGGLLRFQPKSGPRFEMKREDVLLAWQAGAPLPHDAVRLLPAWTVVRLAVPGS